MASEFVADVREPYPPSVDRREKIPPHTRRRLLGAARPALHGTQIDAALQRDAGNIARAVRAIAGRGTSSRSLRFDQIFPLRLGDRLIPHVAGGIGAAEPKRQAVVALPARTRFESAIVACSLRRAG